MAGRRDSAMQRSRVPCAVTYHMHVRDHLEQSLLDDSHLILASTPNVGQEEVEAV